LTQLLRRRHTEAMQIDPSSRTFVHDGQTYAYELRHKLTMSIGTRYDRVISQGSKLVGAKQDVYLTKDTPVDSEHGLAGLLTKTMAEIETRPVLEDVIARPAKLRVIEGGAGRDLDAGEPSVGI
jgi:hypothetical protein